MLFAQIYLEVVEFLRSTANNSMNSDFWTVGGSSINPDEYYEFTITPNLFFQMDITNITGSVRRSGTGPNNLVLSTKNGAEPEIFLSPITITSGSTISVTFPFVFEE